MLQGLAVVLSCIYVCAKRLDCKVVAESACELSRPARSLWPVGSACICQLFTCGSVPAAGLPGRNLSGSHNADAVGNEPNGPEQGFQEAGARFHRKKVPVVWLAVPCLHVPVKLDRAGESIKGLVAGCGKEEGDTAQNRQASRD